MALQYNNLKRFCFAFTSKICRFPSTGKRTGSRKRILSRCVQLSRWEFRSIVHNIGLVVEPIHSTCTHITYIFYIIYLYICILTIIYTCFFGHIINVLSQIYHQGFFLILGPLRELQWIEVDCPLQSWDQQILYHR